MQILEILAIANLIALIILLFKKPILSFFRTIPFIYIYCWLKIEEKRLEAEPLQENEYFVLCFKASKKFLKNITKKKFYRITVSPHDERTTE